MLRPRSESFASPAGSNIRPGADSKILFPFDADVANDATAVTRAALTRQRLPCVGLFFFAAVGIFLGRFGPCPGWFYAVTALAALLAAFRFRAALPLGLVLAFAAAQAWQFRESPAARLAAELSDIPRAATAVFSVLDEPRVNGTGARFIARLEHLTIGGRELPAGCLVLVLWTGAPPAYGDCLEAPAAVMNVPPRRNPGAFDYAAWLANAGVRSQLTVARAADARLLDRGGHPIRRLALASRAWIEHVISLGIAGTSEAALIRGMTVGDTSDASDALKEAFRETGTFHLFSVSGLHVGIVAVLLWTFLGFFGVSQRRSVLIVIPALFFYALITGWSAASVRAALMLSILAAGLLLNRPATPLNSIGAAGLLILAFDSSQLFNTGFQLSFGAVTAIILLAMPIQRWLEARLAPDPFVPAALIAPIRRVGFRFASGGAAVLAVSCAAWLATLPLNIAYFHFVSLTALPANVIAVPLSTVVLGLASIALLAGLVSPWLAEVFNQANYLLAKALIAVVQGFAAVPGSAVYVGPGLPTDTLVQLVALDASPGAATAIFTGRAAWLVDTGNDFFAGSTTLPFLRSRGLNRLDGLALTHGDARHLGGAGRIIAPLDPREVFDSGLPDRSPSRRRLLADLAPRRIPLRVATRGLEVSIPENVRLRVLYPPPGATAVYADDKALALRLEAGAFSALLMADAGAPTEQWLLAHAREDLPSDVVLMGRNVSSPSGDPDFLRAVRPRLVITSGAFFPERERPSAEWMSAMRALDIDILRQDETGAVTLDVTRDRFTATPFLKPPAAKTYSLP